MQCAYMQTFNKIVEVLANWQLSFMVFVKHFLASSTTKNFSVSAEKKTQKITYNYQPTNDYIISGQPLKYE